jgi:predicted phosphoribosyltransferase
MAEGVMRGSADERPCFADRAEAGRLLAGKLAHLALEAPAVYALPRGGVPVAAEIAERLGAPLDLLLVRKIGVPGQPELAAGAVVDGEPPDVVLNEDIVAAAGLTQEEIAELTRLQLREIERRRARYLGARPSVAAAGRDAILVDDGVATGASMEAAVAAMRRRAPRKLVVAVPVASREGARRLLRLADELVCLATPEPFLAIGAFYRDFHQLEDDEVTRVMAKFAFPPW